MRANVWSGRNTVQVENVPDPKILDRQDAIVKSRWHRLGDRRLRWPDGQVPAGAFMNKALTMRTGQCHVQRYLKPLLSRITAGEIDPSFVVTHRLGLDQAPEGYETFKNKRNECVKVVLKP